MKGHRLAPVQLQQAIPENLHRCKFSSSARPHPLRASLAPVQVTGEATRLAQPERRGLLGGCDQQPCRVALVQVSTFYCSVRLFPWQGDAPWHGLRMAPLLGGLVGSYPVKGLSEWSGLKGVRSFRRLALVQVDCLLRRYGQTKGPRSVAPDGVSPVKNRRLRAGSKTRASSMVRASPRSE